MKKRTPDYWSGRFQQLEEAQHDKSLKKMQEIEQQFRRSEQVIQGKINAWYQRFADNNGMSMKEAKRLLNSEELEEFHWDVQDYIRYGKNNAVTGQWMQQLENASAKVHISRLEALKLQCQQEAEVLYGNYLDSVDRHITDIYQSQYYHTAYEIQKGTGIGQHFQSLNQTLVENIIQKPWAVDGRNFSERIWTDKTKLINTLHDSLTRMCITGEAPDRAIREMKKRMQISQAQAARLIQTEAAAFAAKAQQDCYKGLNVEEFEVVETLDEFTCPTCGDMDGKHFPMSEYVVGVTAPPFHPNCRGCTCPYFDDEWTTGGKRAARRKEDGKEYYVPEGMTYKEWKDQYLDKNLSEISKKNKEKISNYLIRSHTPGENISKERMMANKVIAKMPIKVQDAMKNTVIDIGKEGASQYDYYNDILYIAKETEEDGVIHEIGHLVENKILDDQNVQNLIQKTVGEVDITQIQQETFYDNTGNPHDIFLIENPLFISQYQGRVYCETIWDAFDDEGNFKSDLLWEFSSEGFREYIENPEKLKKRNPELYSMLEEALNE